jgi:hypothetical protein
MSIEIEVDLSNQTTAIYTPEVISQTGVERVIQRCKDIVSILVLEVWVPSDRYKTEFSMMSRLGFVIGGTATRADNIFVKFRLPLRSAGDGQPASQLAVMATPIPPSGVEQAAVAEMQRRYGRRDE